MVNKIIRGNHPASEEIINVPTVAALKALDTDGLERAFLGGYFADGDGGGGREFFFDSSSTETDNGGTIHIPTFVGFGGTGRWKMLDVDILTVKQFGAKGDGATNDTAAFTAVRAVTDGRYFINPDANYILDATPDVWDDQFWAGDSVTLTVAGTPFDASKALIGQIKIGATNDTVTDINGARSGVTIFKISDGSSPSQSHVIFVPLETRGVNHGFIQTVASGNTFTDTLFRRAIDDATDPSGNRFSYTYDDANDRFQFSFATTASGSPSFDTWCQIFNGADATPRVEFPALKVDFQQGWNVKKRTSGTFGLEAAVDNTTVDFRDSENPSNVFMTFRAGAFGFFGSTGTSQQTVIGSRGGNVALADLLTKLATTGLIIDGTTA